MKNTGMVRKVDELGRIVLPIELRRVMGLLEGDAIEVFVDEEQKRIALRKYRTQACLFCESSNQLSFYRGQFVCSSCLLELTEGMVQEDVIQESAAGLENINQERDPQELMAMESDQKHGKAMSRLIAVMESRPEATNGEWARLIGVTPSRVSQLLFQLGKSKRK